VGARTGRDGIHGATFASEELSEDADEASRPRVQVGDPFTEKLLLEASLELIGSGHIVAIQDMGAAGPHLGGQRDGRPGRLGVDLEMNKVPVREPGMTPYEILLSESQERMLVVAKAGHEDQVRAILAKWELEAEPVGDGDRRRSLPHLRERGARGVDSGPPPDRGMPHLRAGRRRGGRGEGGPGPGPLPRPRTRGGPHPEFLDLLGSPNLASKRWIYEQYDTTVRTGPPWSVPGAMRG
jgi:phosphoribosylformylglycinamidine synthase subunit PurL